MLAGPPACLCACRVQCRSVVGRYRFGSPDSTPASADPPVMALLSAQLVPLRTNTAQVGAALHAAQQLPAVEPGMVENAGPL